MGQTVEFMALSVSTIAVHALYIIVIPAKAMMMEALARKAKPELTRSIWIILKDFEQEVCFILMFWAMFLIFDKIMQITKSSFLFDVDFLKDNDLSPSNIKQVLAEPRLDEVRPCRCAIDSGVAIKACAGFLLLETFIRPEVVESECAAAGQQNEAESDPLSDLGGAIDWIYRDSARRWRSLIAR